MALDVKAGEETAPLLLKQHQVLEETPYQSQCGRHNTLVQHLLTGVWCVQAQNGYLSQQVV